MSETSDWGVRDVEYRMDRVEYFNKILLDTISEGHTGPAVGKIVKAKMKEFDARRKREHEQ